MKKLILFLALLITLFHASGQRLKRITYDASGFQIENTEPCAYFEVRKDTMNAGDTVRTYYCANKTLKSVATVDADGKYNGQVLYYHPNGNVLSRVNYTSGVLNGSAKSWYDNGTLQSMEVYNRDRPGVPFVLHYWDSSGTQIINGGNGHGRCVFMPFALHPAIGEGKLVSGVCDSVWTFYDKGGVAKYEDTYEKGAFISGRSFGARGEIYPYTTIDIVATPEGGMAGLYETIGRSITYPKEARRANAEGRVFVEFMVDTDGRVRNVKTIKGIGYGCDQEAERVVKIRKWNPGQHRGQPVRQKMVLPVQFKLSG